MHKNNIYSIILYMNGEQLNPERPFSEHRISEIDVSLMAYTELVEWLYSIAGEHSSNVDEVLFCGIDAQPILLNGTFGERTETWAITGSQLMEAADRADRAGSWDTDSPFYYAFKSYTPGIVIFDASKFENLETVSLHDECIRSNLEYRLKSDITMDEAVLATVYITA